MPQMNSSDLVHLLKLLSDASIEVWLDGGWGVDALLGTQTRPHKDVDLIIRMDDVPGLRKVLEARGFTLKEGMPPDSFVLSLDDSLEVDVHAVQFDKDGNGIYRMQNGEDWIYPSEGFNGRGWIEGSEVACLTPSVQVLCHAHGYEPVEKDFRDMENLHARFGVELPPQLRRMQD